MTDRRAHAAVAEDSRSAGVLGVLGVLGVVALLGVVNVLERPAWPEVWCAVGFYFDQSCSGFRRRACSEG